MLELSLGDPLYMVGTFLLARPCQAEEWIPFGVSWVEVLLVLTKVVGAVVSGAHPRLQVGCQYMLALPDLWG